MRLVVSTALLLVLAAVLGEAHKPVTSKYTFNEHVLPIFRARCAGCHVDGGAAPMSLATYADARPWAESIRAELVAGHMPPSQAVSGAGSFVNAPLLPPRDLDIVLTWATGGTPEGRAAREPMIATRPDWPLGPPDVVLQIPREVTLRRGEMERTEEFRFAAPDFSGRAIRAVDLKPGTPAIVRRATIAVAPTDQPSSTQAEDLLTLWSPDRNVVAPRNAAFAFPAGAALTARITYRKTWKYENESLTDRSAIGVYFAAARREILALRVSGDSLVPDDLQTIAVRPDTAASDAEISVYAVPPNAPPQLLIRFLRQREWPERYWFDQPVALPRGTRIEASGPVVIDAVPPS